MTGPIESYVCNQVPRPTNREVVRAKAVYRGKMDANGEVERSFFRCLKFTDIGRMLGSASLRTTWIHCYEWVIRCRLIIVELQFLHVSTMSSTNASYRI